MTRHTWTDAFLAPPVHSWGMGHSHGRLAGQLLEPAGRGSDGRRRTQAVFGCTRRGLTVSGCRDGPSGGRHGKDPGSLNTTITWQLHPEGAGTRLFLEHAGFDLDSPLGKAALKGMGRGWPDILQRIELVLAAASR
jgi:hypothetical protein